MHDESLALFGKDMFDNPVEPPFKGALSQKYIVPPFSVLNARDRAWQNRKRAWIGYGIESELGRADGASSYNVGEWMIDQADGARGDEDGVSIFDPVLCELMYRWFCPARGLVLDPFAGGSVRGVVAGLLGLRYSGYDLNAAQIDANKAQEEKIGAGNHCPATYHKPRWYVGDSATAMPHDQVFDFVFSCPPYGDLEKYGDDPRDLSNMPLAAFRRAYSNIISTACACLLPNRFAAFVVGDYRLPGGEYASLPAVTVGAFQEAGLKYMNEIIFLTPTGSAPVRAEGQFSATRKVVKVHQQVLVFVKGDDHEAAKACQSW